MSEYIYPYIKKVAGIDMSRILVPGFHDTVKAESGRELSVNVREKGIVITDAAKNDYNLQALYDKRSSSVSFGLHTKVKKKDSDDILAVNGRHPDFFAKRFIPTALEYFFEQGLRVEQCMGNWFPGEDNYRKFMRLYKLGNDPVDCAKSTWAGQQFILNGFGRIARENILPFEISEKPASIRASFYRY